MTVKFKINKVPVEAKEGENVLDVARRSGFDVPSLCHHEALPAYGACRLCLVEITKGGRSKLTTSCNYEVLPGIEVITDSPALRTHRAMVLELILSEAPQSRIVQKLAAEYGVDVSRFSRPTDQQEKPGSCIMCGLCVRTCEAVGPAAISTVKRGTQKAVDGPPTGVEACVGCGSCARVCPTNHITIKDTGKTREIWNRQFPMVSCKLCGAPVVTEAYKEFAVEHKGLAADYYTTCEDCKRKTCASLFATVGA